jgi:methionine-rich copper-binding protein CopC
MSVPARLVAGAVVVLAVGAALALADRPADSGPAAVVSTSPADGATLARAPAAVELSFTGRVDPSLSHISVLGSARTSGALRRTAPERLSQPIVAPAAGEVTVAYHVTLTNGAELAGSLRFTARSGNAADPGAPAATHAHGIDPVSAVLLVADGIAVVVAGVLLMRRPRPRQGR